MWSMERLAKRRQSAGLSCSATMWVACVACMSGTSAAQSMMPSPVAVQPSSSVVPSGAVSLSWIAMIRSA